MTAERSLLAMRCANPRLVVELPCPEDLFFHPAHRLIYAAQVAAAEAQEPGDIQAITSRMEASGTLEDAGGIGEVTSVLVSLMATTPEDARYYRSQLVTAKAHRETIKLIDDSLPDLRAMRLPLPEFAESIATAAHQESGPKAETLARQMDKLFAELERSEPREAFSLGNPALDRNLDGGLHRKEMAVVAGLPGGGKSVLLAMAALAAAQAGKAVAFFSLEMPAQDVLKRMASNLAGVRVKAAHEKPSQGEMDRMSRALIGMTDLPLTISDNLTSLPEIEAEARRLARVGKADLIVIDYLQLIENAGPESREQAVSETARRLKNLALTSNSVVLTASQLNEDGRLRESRAIGHHADQVLMIGEDGITIGKNRRGPSGLSVRVRMRGELGRFEETNE